MTTSDLIDKDDPIIQERARRLLRNAAKAVDEFEDAVRELASMRAWIVLGYRDFAEMWVSENGFKCPDHAKAVVAREFKREGLNTRVGPAVAAYGYDGHTNAQIARNIGLPVYRRVGKGEHSPQVSGMLRQLGEGVPADKVAVSATSRGVAKRIEKYGSRARSKPQRVGKNPDESVAEGFSIARRYADAANEHARQMGISKSEVYRQAVLEYLERNGINAFYGQAPNGAVSEVP